MSNKKKRLALLLSMVMILMFIRGWALADAMRSQDMSLAPLITLIPGTIAAGESYACPLTGADDIAVGHSFFDDLDTSDDVRWSKADWGNPLPPFWNYWRPDHITFADGEMHIQLDNSSCPQGCDGRPYASGEYRSNEFYGYGRFETRMKASNLPGTVTAFFLYTGPSDANPHDEIDIEILGKDPTRMQVNYFTNDVGNHETWIDLGFDASQDYHDYSISWSENAITWCVDGTICHTEDGSHGPLPTTPGRIMTNLWACTQRDEWCGSFTYPGTPVVASYDWIRYMTTSVYLPLVRRDLWFTSTSTSTPTPTKVNVSTPTPSSTMTRTPTRTPTSTNSPTNTPTRTPSPTPTRTPTATNSPTNTPTPTPSPSHTPTRTLTPTSSPTNTSTPTVTPGFSGSLEDFEDISDWNNVQGDLDTYALSTDRVQGSYSMRLGGDEDPGSETWVGEAQRYNWTASPIDWRSFSVLRLWVKKTSVYTPQIALVLHDIDGGVVALHQDSDTCLNWFGGGWRSPITMDSWTMLEFPLRQENPVDCYYPTDIDWSRVTHISIRVYTDTDRMGPVYLLVDDMQLQ